MLLIRKKYTITVESLKYKKHFLKTITIYIIYIITITYNNNRIVCITEILKQPKKTMTKINHFMNDKILFTHKIR